MTDFEKIWPRSLQQRALMELYDGKNGGDLYVLQVFAGAVFDGQVIEANFQLVVNAIVAQSIFRGKLPPNPKGRPINADITYGRDVAYYYFELRDGGVNYSDAVAEVAAFFHKDERHIMRLVKENKDDIGLTAEDRKRNREFLRKFSNGENKYINYALQLLRESREQDSLRQPVAELDALIEKLLERIVVTDRNEAPFIASD